MHLSKISLMELLCDVKNNDVFEENEKLDEFNLYYLIGLLLKKIPDRLDSYLQKKFPDYFNLKEKIKMKGDPMFDLFGDDVKNVLDEYNRK